MGRFVAPFAALIFGCALDFVLSEAIRPRDANDTEGYPHGTLSRPREPTQMADPLEEPYWLPLAYEVQLAHLSRPPLVVPGDDIDRECAPARENFYARTRETNRKPKSPEHDPRELMISVLIRKESLDGSETARRWLEFKKHTDELEQLILSKSQIPNEKRTFEVRDFDYVSKSFQRTALTAACRLQYDAEGFVLHLLSRGADIDFARPSDHKTALIQAVRSHNAPLLDLLLTTDKLSKAVQLHLEEYPLPDGYPKVPPVREADVNLADGDGNTALIHAAAAGVLEAGTALLDKDTRPGHLNLAGDSALHVAVKENKHLFVRMMMKRVEPKKHVNSLGETLGPDGEALDHPTVSSSSSSVKNRELLKDAGGKFIIDPNIKNADGFTPLMVAAQKGRVLPAVELLHRCNGNEKYPSGLRSALMEALAHRSHGVALALLNWQLRPGMGLKSMPGVFSNAKSPYFLGKKAPSTTMGAQAEADSDATAADFEDSIMASMDNSVDLNIQDKDGETALVYAVQSGDVDVLRALLKMGADPNMHDNLGRTAFLKAEETGAIEMLEILMTRHHSRPHSAGALGQREGEGDGEGSFLFPSQGSDKTQNGNSAEIQQEQPALSQQSEDEPGAEGMTKEARERETKYERKTGEGETDREKQGDNKRSADDEESQPSHNEDQESKERKEGWMSPGLANLSRPIDPLWPFNASSLLLRPLGLLSSVLGGGSRASEGPPEAPLGSSGIENMFRPDGDVLPRGNEMNRRKGERPGGEVGPSTSFVSSGSASEGGDEDVMPSSFLEMHSAVEQAEETRLTVVPRPVEAVGQIDSPTFPHRQLPLGSFRDHSPASALEAAEDPLDEEGPGMPSQGAGAGGDTPMTDPQDFPNPSEGSAEPASGSPDLMGEGGGDTAPPPLDEGLSQQGGTASAFTEKATDVNARDAMKNTALMLAARENKCKVVDVLLSGGGAVKEGDFQETVDPNLRDAKGRTALMLNIIEGHGQCVEEFLKDRPEVPVEKRVNINEWDNEGLSAMSHAVETNNLGVLKQLLSSKSVSLFNRDTSAEEGESVMSAESSSSFRLPETVLHTAVRHFSEEALEVLLEWIEKKGGTEPEKAEKILNSRNQKGYPPLSLAVELSFEDGVKKLLEKTKSLEGDLLKVNKEFHGQTPLLQAIVTRNDHIAEDLLRDERVDVSLPGPDGTTALTSVINRQSLPLLELMVKNPSFKKHPPLSHPMFVTEGPESPLVQLFEKDSFGKNESAIISVLQLEDYSRLSQESEDSQSFMEKFAHKLPSAPEDTWGTSLESSHLVGGRGQGGWRSGGGGSRYMSLQQQREEMKRKGTEMNRDRLCLVRSRERRTVLWFAGRFNHLSVVETLLSMMKQMRSRNCRVHESDVNGETPLAAALTHLAPLSAMPLIRLLFNAVDSETEDTPLTAAMQSDAAKRLVPLFLEKFSTPPLSETPELLKLEEKNKKGETPACLAVELGLTEEAEILVKKAKSLEAYNVIADALYCAAKKGDDALMHKCVATHEQSLDTVLTDRIQYTHQIDHKEVENTEDIQAALALIPHVPPRSKCDTDGGTQHGGDERSTFDVTTWSPFGGGEEDGSAKIPCQKLFPYRNEEPHDSPLTKAGAARQDDVLTGLLEKEKWDHFISDQVKDALQVIAGIPDPPMKLRLRSVGRQEILRKIKTLRPLFAAPNVDVQPHFRHFTHIVFGCSVVALIVWLILMWHMIMNSSWPHIDMCNLVPMASDRSLVKACWIFSQSLIGHQTTVFHWDLTNTEKSMHWTYVIVRFCALLTCLIYLWAVERYWHIGIPCGLMIVMSLGRSMQSYFLSESEARAVAEDFLREGTNPKDFWPPSENEEFNFDISEDEESDEDLVKYEDELMKAAVISPRNYYTITGVSGLCAFLMAMSCVFQRWVMRNYLEFYKFEKSFHSLDGTVKFWTAVGVEVMLVLCLWFITFDVLKPFTLAWATLQNRTARCRCFLTHFPLDKLASSDQDLALRYVEKWGEKRGALLDLFRKRWSSVSAAFNVLLGVLLMFLLIMALSNHMTEREYFYRSELGFMVYSFVFAGSILVVLTILEGGISNKSMHRHWDELLSLRTNKKTMTTDAKLSIDRIVATYMRRDPLVEIFGVRVQVTFALFVALVILLFLGYILDLHEPEGYLNMKFKRQFGLDTMS